MELESHSQHPIVNAVEIVSVDEFRPSVLRPRIDLLVNARTVRDLLAAVDPVARNLSVYGDASFAFDVAPPPTTNTKTKTAAPGPGVLPIKTVVTLANTRPAPPVSLSIVTSDETAGIQAATTVFNKLGRADSLTVSAQVQPKPYELGSGSAVASIPMPIGAGKLAVSAFFFNQDRPWASYALASHGISAQISVPWSRHLLAAFGVEATSRQIAALGDAASDSIRASASSESTKISVLASVAHTGSQHHLDVSAEVAGRPGDSQYTKVGTSGHFFRSLVGAGDVVADLNVSGGYIHGQAPIFDRFVLGGPKDVYGFAINSLGPRDGDDFTGGSAFYSARGTLTARVPGHPLSPLRLVALGNLAVLQNNAAKTPSGNIHNLLRTQPAAAVAAGITYRTPAANCELLYVKPVQASATDVTREGLHFGVGISVA